MIDIATIQIHSSWKKVIGDEFQKSYFEQIKNFLKEEKANGNTIYPKGSDIFNAFNQAPFDDVKVVILGQDPYHGEGEAHGLCFSVQDGIRIPPSLKNIFKELLTDIPGFIVPSSGNLISWAKQGVFLLNATLTVRKDTPNSHKDAGWQQFTDAVIKKISDEKKGVVFLLWGAYAQGKIGLIDQDKHLVLQAVHPSPFSAYKGFFGCKHFSKTNDFLISKGKTPINWLINP
ncbi:MAG: uracil-DNA glycosylase [Candidatus Absconditabacteria bacterium]|nr:uracil-DNA glycosylase [Candidatus Absconditabacteria bacterium]